MPPRSSPGHLGASGRFAGLLVLALLADGSAAGAEAVAAVRGRIDLNVTERPLGDILQYIERVSGWNLVPTHERINDLLVTVRLTNIYWRDALNVIATTQKLTLREEVKAQVIYIEQPPLIRFTFVNTDIKRVVDAIAGVGNASVVVGPQVQGNVTMNVQGVPWREALEIVLKTLGYVLVEEKHGVLRVATPEELQQQMETRVVYLSYLMPEGSDYVAKIDTDFAERIKGTAGGRGGIEDSLRAVLEKVKSPNGSIGYEKRTNSVVLTDTPAKLEAMAKIIRELDRPPKQVHLIFKFIEMSETDAEELGINWGESGITAEATGMAFNTLFPFALGSPTNVFQGTPPGRLGVITDPATGYTVRLDQVPQLASGSGVSLGRLNMLGLKAVLKLIQTRTNAKVTQAPEITCLDNEEATIQVGDLVRYAESDVQSTEGGGTAYGWKEATRSPVKLGIQVLVKPHVTGPENNVLLIAIPKIESQTGATLFEEFVSPQLGTLKLPQTSQRVVVTKMLLRNRETGVIAGLRHEVRGETVTKIPVLGDIPIIGWLFRSRSRPRETNKVNHIIIFITPTVIDLQEREALREALAPSQRRLRDLFTVYGEQ